MANDFDDIAAQMECPVCGRTWNIPYKTLRIQRTIECLGCGETIRPIDNTPIGCIQKLIDEIGK